MVEVHEGQRWDYVGPSGRREYVVEQMVSHAQFVGAKLRNLATGGYAWATRSWLNEDDHPSQGHWELVS